MDARAEIEAKRERLARLREQRQRMAAGTYKSSSPDISTESPAPQPAQLVQPQPQMQPDQKPKWSTVSSTIFRTEPVIYYSKSTQTEDPPEIAEVEESFSEISLADVVEPISEPPRVPTPEVEFKMAESLDSSQDAIGFLDRAWRIVSRVKDLDNPSQSAFDSTATQSLEHVRGVHSFQGPEAAVLSIEWHPQRSDVLAVSFREMSDDTGANGNASHIFVWCLRAPSEPESTLLSSTDIASIHFGLSNTPVLFGAGLNGRIAAWDLRTPQFDAMPFTRSTDEGHAFPVRAFALSGTNLISCAEDGTFCIWAQDVLTKPQSKLHLTANVATAAALDGLGPSSPTALAVHPYDNTQFVVGSLDGSLYRGFRVDSVTTRAGISGEALGSKTTRHTAGITCLDFRKASREVKSVGYMLSGALDWTIKLWHVGLEGNGSCLVTLFVDDIVSDLAWAPGHPSLFAAGCQNKLQIWDLNKSVDLPVFSLTLPWLVSRVAWSASLKIAVGGVTGQVQICEVDTALLEYDELSWSKFNDRFK